MRTPWASIARIQVDGEHSGTGFLVSSNRLLTALHVVADQTGRPFPQIRAFFDTNAEFSDGAKVFETNARLIEGLWSSEHDFALLECDRVPLSSKPFLLSDRYQQSEECASPGFAVQKPSGFTAMGAISSLNDPIGVSTAIGIQFRFCSGVLIKGHSGAPVLVKDRVIGLLRTAFLDESEKTMGGIVHATSIQQIVAFCDRLRPGMLTCSTPVVWPASLPKPARMLADRKVEFEIFLSMLAGQRKERVLLLKGQSGSGKTALMGELMEYTRSVEIPVAAADCKGTPSLDHVFESLVMSLSAGVLPNTEAAGGGCRGPAMIDELALLERPLLIALDTWKDSSDILRDWMRNRLLPKFAGMPAVLLVISGQEVPDHTVAPWRDISVFRELEPIRSTKDWLEYSRRRWPAAKIDKLHVEGITLGSNGMPSVIAGFLETLQGGLLARSTESDL